MDGVVSLRKKFTPLSASEEPFRTAICVSEDRKQNEVAAELAICSAAVRNPHCKVIGFLPHAAQSTLDSLGTHYNVQVRPVRPGSLGSWNIKPEALLEVLEEGHENVWWVDSDVLVLTDIVQRYGVGDEFLVTEEALYGRYSDNGLRARAWKLKEFRSFPHTLNSAVIRVNQKHKALLRTWISMMRKPEYQEAQILPWHSRPPHLQGDQDVLTALLCSNESQYTDVKVLKRGSDIIQYFGPYGYTVRERIDNLLVGPPAFVHSQGPKPWCSEQEKRGKTARHYFDNLMSETSPYCAYAFGLGQYSTNALSWARPKSKIGKFLWLLGLGQTPLRGLPLSAAADFVRLLVAIRARIV